MLRTSRLKAKDEDTTVKVTIEMEFSGLTTEEANKKARTYEDRVFENVLLPSFYSRYIEVE
jgi:hypothetical protein